MARPKKTGLDSFPFDVDFFEDDKISSIFVEFGIKGEITTIKLLCAIYRQGYFIEWRDSVRISLLRALPGVSPELLEQIVKALVKWRFFDPDMFFKHHVLTSHAIQKRYFAIVSRNNRAAKREALQYLLNTPEDCDVYMPKPTPPPVYVDESKLASDMKNSPLWLEQMSMRHRLNKVELLKRIDAFFLDCRCRDKAHQSTADAKRHFNDWLLTQTRLERNSNNGYEKRKPSKKVTATAADFAESF